MRFTVSQSSLADALAVVQKGTPVVVDGHIVTGEAAGSAFPFALKLVEKLSDYLQSDLTAQQLSDLAQRLDKSTVSPIRTADGQLVEGEEHYEFYVDEASLWELVRTAYCQE